MFVIQGKGQHILIYPIPKTKLQSIHKLAQENESSASRIAGLLHSGMVRPPFFDLLVYKIMTKKNMGRRRGKKKEKGKTSFFFPISYQIVRNKSNFFFPSQKIAIFFFSSRKI